MTDDGRQTTDEGTPSRHPSSIVRHLSSVSAMLVIEELSVRLAGRLLLDRASARLPTGARVGLVGRNGAGKTTLFRVISGEIVPEHGGVRHPARACIDR